MRDVIFKLRVLWALIRYEICTWREDIWPVDLDERYCCSCTPPDFCGCGGATHREMWEWEVKR